MSDYYDKWDKLTKEQKSRLYRIENDNNFDHVEDIACPYCDMPLTYLEHSDVPYEDEDEVEYTCGFMDCGKKFTITARVSYSWDTKVPDDEAMAILQAELKEQEKDNEHSI